MILLISFTGMLCFGISNCLWRPAFRVMNLAGILFYRSFYTVIIMSLLLMVYYSFFPQNPPDLIQFSVLKALGWILLSFAGLVLLTVSLRYNPAGISGSVVMTIGIFGAFAAHFIRNDPWPEYLLYIIYLYAVGFALIDKAVLRTFLPDRGVTLALCAAACWALANLGFKEGIEEMGAYTFAWLQELVVLTGSGVWLGYQKIQKGHTVTEKQENGPIFLLALLTLGGIVCANVALGQLSLMQFACISMVQPVATMVISKWIQREQISTRQLAGAAFLLAGAFLSLL